MKGTFTAGHLTSASEFKKQLLHLAPGAMYSGSSAQLERMMLRQLDNIKVVQTMDFVGYSIQHKTYLLGQHAVHDGHVLEANEEDYFEIGKLSIKSLQRSIHRHINKDADGQDKSWPQPYGRRSVSPVMWPWASGLRACLRSKFEASKCRFLSSKSWASRAAARPR